jgi:hypothetical protein
MKHETTVAIVNTMESIQGNAELCTTIFCWMSGSKSREEE